MKYLASQLDPFCHIDQHSLNISLRYQHQKSSQSKVVTWTAELTPSMFCQLINNPFETIPDLEKVIGQPLLVKWSLDDRKSHAMSYLCSLDVDVPSEGSYDWFDVWEPVARQVRPAPMFSYQSHGGGMRLFYRCDPGTGTTAAQLAAIAAASISVMELPVYPTFELKTDSWHPQIERNGAKCYLPFEFASDGQHVDGDDILQLDNWVVSEFDKEAYIEDNGIVLGQRLPHSHCKFHPEIHGQRDPVVYDENGIYCFRCSLGLSWAKLLGKKEQSPIARLLDNFVHWGHAKHQFRDYFPDLNHFVFRSRSSGEWTIDRIAYHGLLTLNSNRRDDFIPGTDPRVLPAILDNGHCRIGPNQWVDDNGGVTTFAAETVATFPACLYVSREPVYSTETREIIDEEIETRTNLAKRDTLRNSTNAIEMGYQNVYRINGSLIHGLVTDHQYDHHPETLRVPFFAQVKPEHRPELGRSAMEITQAFSVLRDLFPGVSVEYVCLLLACRGIAENGGGISPMLLINGPSGSGKSITPYIVAAILGGAATSPSLPNDRERVKEQLYDARSATFIVADEIVKIMQRTVNRFILEYDSQTTARKNYVGPVTWDLRPPLIMTDTSDFPASEQISRRTIKLQLLERCPDWRTTSRDRGLKSLLAMRRHEEFRNMSDTILGWFLREVYAPGETLQGQHRQILKVLPSLGATSTAIVEADRMDIESSKSVARELFRLICEASPKIPTSDKQRYGPGYVKITPAHDTDPLNAAWAYFADDTDARNVDQLLELDLRSVIGAQYPVAFKLNRKSNYRTVFVRVEPLEIHRKKSGYRNSEIVCNEKIELIPGITENQDFESYGNYNTNVSTDTGHPTTELPLNGKCEDDDIDYAFDSSDTYTD